MTKPRALTTLLSTLIAVAAVVGSAAATELPDDPLKSVMWRDMAQRFLADGPVVLDERIKIAVPGIVERQTQVPITVDARAVPDVVSLVVFADLNPIQHVLTLRPKAAAPYVSVRIKVEQGTPLRAAAKTSDGTWHVGSVYLEAAGGGCSAPAMARGDADWSATVGQTRGNVWREAAGLARVRLSLRHPMDTGLAKDNTPAFFIDRLALTTDSGKPLLEIDGYEPISENPTLTVMLALPSGESGVKVEARDNNGGSYKSYVPAPWRQSALTPRVEKP